MYDAGKWDITDTGYVAITLRGVQKSGINFADISDFEISGTVTEGAMAYTPNDEEIFIGADANLRYI